MDEVKEEQLLTTKQVATRLNCSSDKAYDLMRSQYLKTINLSSPTAQKQCLRVTSEELDRFIEQGGCSW